MFSSPSDMQMLFQGVSRYIPLGILKYIGNTSKNPLLMRMREVSGAATVVAKQMVEEKAEMLLQGKGSRDVFSLLGECRASFRFSKSDKSAVKANMDTEAKAKLAEEELFAQMRCVHDTLRMQHTDCRSLLSLYSTILFTGHETPQRP